jgi:hypothetical protein
MNAEQIRRFKNWLSKLSCKCPFCGGVTFTPGEVLMAPTYTLNGEKPSPIVPEVQLVCSTCGYIAHFAAMPVGIVA